jgi:hypothetical protein
MEHDRKFVHLSPANGPPYSGIYSSQQAPPREFMKPPNLVVEKVHNDGPPPEINSRGFFICLQILVNQNTFQYFQFGF